MSFGGQKRTEKRSQPAGLIAAENGFNLRPDALVENVPGIIHAGAEGLDLFGEDIRLGLVVQADYIPIGLRLQQDGLGLEGCRVIFKPGDLQFAVGGNRLDGLVLLGLDCGADPRGVGRHFFLVLDCQGFLPGQFFERLIPGPSLLDGGQGKQPAFPIGLDG